jgi:hypothetical protein
MTFDKFKQNCPIIEKIHQITTTKGVYVRQAISLDFE